MSVIVGGSSGASSVNLNGPASGLEMYSHKVEWVVEGISRKLNEVPRPKSIWSPEFSVAGLKSVQLEFFPNGRENTTMDGFCSLFLWCPEGYSVKYQLFVNSHVRAPDEDVFDTRMGHGHSNFCKLAPEIDLKKDSVTIGVQIVCVKKLDLNASGITVYCSSLKDIIQRELQVVENKAIRRVEWKIPNFSKKIANYPRGASMYSPIFTACGIREIILEFYPNGSSNTTKDGFCALYIRCQEETQIVVTLFVGNFSKGPILAKFEGPSGKGLPDFCSVSEEVNKEDDSLTVGIELKPAVKDDDVKKTLLQIGN